MKNISTSSKAIRRAFALACSGTLALLSVGATTLDGNFEIVRQSAYSNVLGFLILLISITCITFIVVLLAFGFEEPVI